MLFMSTIKTADKGVEYMSDIELAIAKLRKQKNITQAQLAEHLGVSFQAVSKWENGMTMPDITLLPHIANYFEVSVD